jgi:hypothetical protein
MAFPTSEEHLQRAERQLGLTLPPTHRSRLLRINGGEVEAAGDTWELFAVQDTTDRKRLSRSASHIVRETTEARTWPRFPGDAVAIAANIAGDYLVLRPAHDDPGSLADTVLLWDHEEGTLNPVDVLWDL